MEQKIEPLSDEWAAHNEKQRSWVRDHYIEESQHKFSTLDGKLFLLQGILDAEWIERTETWKLQALGIVFGDALQHEFPFEWVVVTDEYGTCPALHLPGTAILLFVWTTISKRVERGDNINIFELFEGFCNTTKEGLANEGVKPN